MHRAQSIAIALAVLLLALLLTWAPLAHAQSAPTRCNPAMQCCRQANLPGDPGCAGGGNPINLLTGNKYQQETELAPLPGVQGLEIVRRYNSASALDTHPNRANGILGKGWRLSYEIELSADSEHQRNLTLADGSQVSFTRGVLQPTHFIAADLGQGRLVEQSDGTEWQRLDGQRYGFNRQGRLVQIHAATGEFTSLAYDGQGRLIKVTDPQGRSLVLHSADAASTTRYRGVSAIDTPVGRFEYRYGSAEAASNLVRVTLPGHVQRSYHYEDPRHANALTGISVGEQRLSSYLYDAQGLAVLSVKGTPAKLQTDASGQPTKPYRLQDGSGIEQVIVERGKDGVTVLNSLNQASQAKWAEIAGQRLITEFRGAGCAHCPPTNTRWAYDKQGRVTETLQLDAQGRPMLGERNELDAWGRVRATHRVSYHSGKAQTDLIARFDYPAPFAEGSADATQPTLIARPSVVPGKELVTRIDYNAHGQPTAVSESGFSPIDDKGEPNGTPIARTSSYKYSRVNGRSVLTQIDGPLANGAKNSPEDSDITTLRWDERGSMVTAIVQPGAFKTEVSYDEAVRLHTVRNDEGAQSRYHYTATGQLAKLERSTNGGAVQTQTFEYDAQGRLVETGAGSGSAYKAQTRMAYDSADRLLWRAHALGWAEQWRRDSEGRMIEEGRFSSRIVQSSVYEWNDDGSLKAVSDNAGRRVVLPTTAALTATRTLSVRPEVSKGERIARTRHLADDFGRVVLTRSADSGTTVRSFDAADRLNAMRDALSHEARYEYDTAGRIVKQSAQAKDQAPIVTQWRYQGRRLVELTHPTQSERYTYDAQGQRTARSVVLKGHTAITRYERDANGAPIATTLPDGSRIAYERNGQGQITMLTRSRVQTDWLRSFEQKQVLAKDFERDLVGLANYTAGNGIEAKFIRSKEGTLARVLYRQPQQRTLTASTQNRLLGQAIPLWRWEQLLGIAQAHATPVRAEPVEALNDKASNLPGALGHPQDPQALIDHRYLWDGGGNLLLDRQRAGAQPRDSTYAYDWQDRLIVASTQASQSAALQPVSQKADVAPRTSYYLHDAQGRRVLAQDAGQVTRRIAYEDRSNRWRSDADVKAEYDASGQPRTIGKRRFEWDAHGRLLQVRDSDELLATYQYSHRGQRIEKKTDAQHTLYLYDEQSQLMAELDADGKIKRQYIYAANLPIAVIDGDAALYQDTAAWLQAFIDLSHIARSWIGGQDNTAWLHTNHLGAPEAATDGKGQMIWQASYSASGRAKTISSVRPEVSKGFTLNLRLPGQYADTETGLHYNAQRYYDPERGQYLSPDPLANGPGYPDGPSPYAYVRYNPLRYVDPQGLVLFAFDGTGNGEDSSDPAMADNGFSNVKRFYDAYQGNSRYVSGVGTVHHDTRYGDIVPATYASGTRLDWLTGSDPLYLNDEGGNYSGPARIDRMMRYFNDEADAITDDDEVMDIDIIGFSRGAAQARDFANRLATPSRQTNPGTGQLYWSDGLVRQRGADGVERLYYRFHQTSRDGNTGALQHSYRCQRVNFRFMGIWETVLSTNYSGTPYNLAIPSVFAYVAHATALNEYRSDTLANWGSRNHLPYSQHFGGFPLVSIGASSSTPGRVRVERGFIGAHADIGGGYRESEAGLSLVALNWMVRQATDAGVQVLVDRIPGLPTTNPILHDQSNAMNLNDPRQPENLGSRPPYIRVAAEDREVSGAVSGNSARTMGFNNNSMTNADTHRYINYTRRDVNQLGTGSALDPTTLANRTGTVEIAGYLAWLRAHGYCFVGDTCP
jgi:RHS repeat-associated protein